MNWFLRAKHWQIFILIFVAPVVIELIGFMLALTTRHPEVLFVCVFIMMAIILGVQFGWFYNVGTALANRVNPNGGMNVKRFRNFVLIPVIYIGALMLGMIVFGFFMMNSGRPSPYTGLLLIIVIPMHFFSMFCIFYSIWFISKSLKMAERWTHVELSDYIGDFFLTWFLFVGIWFIQPRINRMFDPTLPPQMIAPSTFQNPQYYSQNYPPQNPSQGS
ncbi:hypothetical protein BH11BAC7_BH11BAC7_15480 [soil metagenome]